MSESALFRRFSAVLSAVDRVSMFVVTVCMAVLTSVLLLQVFFRYALNESLDWGWDVPRVCFIWMVLLSIPLGIRNNAHVGIDLLVDLFSDLGKRVAVTINAAFMLVLSLVLAYYAVQLMGDTWDQLMPNIPLPVGVFYAALAISQLHAAMHLVRILVTGQAHAADWSET